MSWITQQQGLIDHAAMPHLVGTQPIRVLHNVNMVMFENTHLAFKERLTKAIAEGKLSPKIDLQLGEVAITKANGYHTPKFNHDTKQIILHETFLSYQWCITYAIFVIFLETIDYPKQNSIAGYEKYPVTPENIAKAKEIFAYARFIIAMFDPWNKDELPNPEKYMAEKRTYVEQTNIMYSEGMKFIMLHEFVHATKHPWEEGMDKDQSYYFEIENEADGDAIDMILAGRNPITRYAIESGPVFGIISMIFFDSVTSGKKHPNVEDRLSAALKRLKVADNEYAWSFACVGIQLWAEQFEIFFDWSLRDKVPYEYLYYDIVKQLKEQA